MASAELTDGASLGFFSTSAVTSQYTVPTPIALSNFQDAHALPLDQRKERLREIEAEIAILEHREEFMIMHVASEGVIIERRYDASPSAILGVQIAKPATARAA